MEDEERQRKLEAGKAKLAEYRQRKAQSDGQKKKKKKKNKGTEGEQEECEEKNDAPPTELSFSRTLCSGETVKHEQTFTIEPESEISTTAEDYSSEEEELFSPSRLHEMENELAAKNMAVEELSRELEEIRASFGAEGVQQLQDFEAALKHRDGIITQLTANLQQARAEKDEVMREFLDLTEKSQKLQIQFQQLQAGESVRSSSISTAAADLLQARQQVLLCQQQLDEKDTTVKSLQLHLEDKDGTIKSLREKTEENDRKVKHLQEQLQESVAKVTSLQEHISEMTQIQQRMSEVETISRDTEIALTQTLQKKDLQIREQEKLIVEHQQSLSQLQDNLQESEKRFGYIGEQLEAKICDLQSCEAELQASKEKEQLSSSEILHLMGTVEELQKRNYQGNQLESDVLQRAELDAAQRLDHLRAELDEMYGQQIVQIKQELVARHKEEMANILNRHSTKLKNVSEQHLMETEQLTSQLTQSTGDVNALSVRVIELQQRLQEVTVLREKAEHDLTLMSEEKVLLQSQVQQLIEDLRLKKQEKSQSEVHLQLTATITGLQAQLASLQEASSELEAKHESEITNYQIKLEMLEREKDAVLDRMAESQEAELERLRTQLLFSHEEELSRLREDLQHESQMNVENLRDELNQQHNESVQQLSKGYEEQIRVAEEKSLLLAAERTSLLQEILTLKNDLSQALENSQVEELVSQLETLQAEIQDLRQRQGEEVELAEESKQRWEGMESECKLLNETNATLTVEVRSLEEERKVLIKKIDTLISENRQATGMTEELRAEIERQKSTFSFAEKNFDVNLQELRAELQLASERLQEQALQVQVLETQLQNLNSEMKHGSIQSEKEHGEKPVEGAPVEKDTTELMEKLQSVVLERQDLVKQVEQKDSEMKKVKLESVKLEELMKSMEGELRRVQQENTGLSEHVQQKEAKLKMAELEKLGLIEQLGQMEVELKRSELERAELEEKTKLKDLELKRVELKKVDLVQQVEQKEAEFERMKLEKAELAQQLDQRTLVLQQKETELQKIKIQKAELEQQMDQITVVLKQKEADLQKIKIEKTKLVQQMDQKTVVLQQKEADLEKVMVEKAEVVQQLDRRTLVLQQKETDLQKVMAEKAELVQQMDQRRVVLQQKEADLQKIKIQKAELEQQMDKRTVVLKQKEAELQKIKIEKTKLVQQMDQKTIVLQQKEADLQKIKIEKTKLVQQMDQKTILLQQKEADLQKVKTMRAKLLKQVDQKEVELQQKEVGLQRVAEDKLLQAVEQKDVAIQKKKALQRMKPGKAEHTDQFQVKKAGLKAARKATPKASRGKGSEFKPDIKKMSRLKIKVSEAELHEEEAELHEEEAELHEEEAELQEEGNIEQLLTLPLSQTAEVEDRLRETDICLVHRDDGVKLQTHAHTKIKAAEETRSQTHTRTHTHTHTHTRTHTRTHTQPAAAVLHTADENKLKSVLDKQVEWQRGDTDLVDTVTLTDSMEGYEHEECRLQLEAQRISLSQIHAAQLELLKERLPEWEEHERPGMTKASAVSSSLISITQDFTHLLQMIAGVCGVDSVDVTQEQLLNLQPSTIRTILHTTQEVYRKLQQLHTGDLSSHTCATVSLSENGNENVKKDLQQEVEQKMELQENVKQKMELQEEVKQKMELQEEVKQKMELQEEVKQKMELQEEVKQKMELQEEVKQKMELQEQVKQKMELQEQAKQKMELQEQAKQKTELQEEVKQKTALQEEVKQKTELQEEVKQKMELQEEVKQKMELQEEVKQKMGLQEEVKQKMELQDEVKQKVELQENVKQKTELQEEVKQKTELQEEVKQKTELQEEVKQKTELQEEGKQKTELQEEGKQKTELQEEGKQKTELQEAVKQKTALQVEVKQKIELQEEQHRQEIQRLRSYFSQQIRDMEECYTNKILLLQERLQEVTPADTLHSMPDISAEEQQLQMRQYEMEEQIARVIVQMSVEFARQSEMNRVCVQDEQRVETREGAEPERQMQMEEEQERGGSVCLYPSMQCNSTQTDMLRRSKGGDEEKKDEQCEEEEEEVIVTSQLTFGDTQERVHQVLMDLVKMAVLMEEMVKDEPITCPADMSETDNSSSLSGATDTDEGLDVSREVGLAVERAGSLWSVCSRLQKAVQKLIITLTDTHIQLDHARLTRTELMKEKFSYDQQIADLLNRQEELQQRLEEEKTAREKLTLQLHHAEGLIDGYSDERRALEEQVHEGTTRQQQLEVELRMTNSRLHELHQERQDVKEQHDLLLRQRDVIKGGATETELSLVEAAVDDTPEAGLLEETEKLLQEKVDVQRQAQKDHAELQEQVKQLETELEEQVRSMVKLEESHLSETSDLRQKIHALEKQLENNRRFLDEQAADREHERDVFQQEIQKLEQQLKGSSKTQADHREVEELSVALREKTDWCSELSLRVEQLQRDVQERDEEIETQEERVRVLEEVFVSHDNRDITPAREDSKQYASMAGGGDATLEALLQTEREALDRKEKEIVNLEEQLEQFREELQNKSEEVQQLHMQLEIQRKEISTQQQDLQAQSSVKTVLEEKDRQISLLNEQLDKLQRSETWKPDVKEVEVKNQLIQELESQVEHLRGEQDRLKRGSEEEVEQLNSVIEKLQQELSKIEHKQSVQEEEYDDEDQNDELKQKMDQIQRELYTLKEDHSLLLSTYGSMQEEKEKKYQMLALEFEDMLREKTAALLVAQVQIQALGESANSTVSSLTQRMEQLLNCLEEREVELRECRSTLDNANDEAGTLHLKVSKLEEKLRENVATLSQSVNQQYRETSSQTEEPECNLEKGTLLNDDKKELMNLEEALSRSNAGKEIGLKQQYGIELNQENDGKELESKVISGNKLEKDSTGIEPSAELMGCRSEIHVEQREVNTTESIVLLMDRLRKLEVDISSIPKGQELEKHLLAISQEEVEEYEKMLTKLIQMLDQIKSTSPPEAASSDRTTEIEQLIQELQQARDQSATANEQLDSCRNQNQNLEAQIQHKEEQLRKLQEELNRASERSTDNATVISALQQELHEVKGQAKATKEELNSCKELGQRLQEQIQEREMMITRLKDQVHRETAEMDRSKLLQELQEVKHEAATTKEQLNSYIEQCLKLQEQIQAREASIAQLMEELQEHRTALTKSQEEKVLVSSQKKTGQVVGGSAAEDQDTQSVFRQNSVTSLSTPSDDGSQGVSTVDMGTQVEGEEPGLELEEVIGEYSERIGQIRELHAAEIMDMENRHIAESESLKKENQRLEQECATLREGIDQLRPIQGAGPDHSTSSVYRDGYTSDSSSEVGSEFRSTPEGARQDDTHLPDKIKALLREVHQEGMQVLSLSELSVCDETADRSSLLAQIAHLQAQLTQLRLESHTTQHVHRTPDETDKHTERNGETDECERLRAELAQVKLELMTSLKTEHTHKRELNTLRAEVCLKTSELDAASDHLAEEQRQVRELQWEVERERNRAEGEREELEDVKLALEEERRLSAQIETELSKYTGLVTQLQVQLESQNCRLNELSSDLQREKELNAELLKHTQHPLQVEGDVPSVADSMLQSLQDQLKEKQATLMALRAQAEQRLLQELEQKQQWQDERRHLQRRVDELQCLLEGEKEQRMATERERGRLECRVSELMEKRSTSKQVGDQVLEQKSGKSVPLDSINVPVLTSAGATYNSDMDSVVVKLQQMSSKINRLAVEGPDGQGFSWLQRNLQEVVSFLQKCSSAPPAGPESTVLLTGGVSSGLTERLLRQNAELTGFVSRLTEEKNELRNQILRLEEELRRLRHLKAYSSLSFGSELPESVFEIQKEVWMREKSTMEKSLHQAEAEISRLRAEIRSDVARDFAADNDTDNATIKRIYGKYLRAESFRKALIYQKKYLLLLLGGFQECEEATLSLISGMAGPNVYAHNSFLECVSQRRRGYTRFRSAARVCIALFRMRFLVRRWQKVTGGSITINRNGVGHSPVMEVRTDSPYLQPYGERRGTTRGRTGRESPHTAHTTQHRYGGTDGGVLCSHIQSYDPDRALSDYITRLEALQRRLGSVQSGSSSYTQLHFGLRR